MCLWWWSVWWAEWDSAIKWYISINTMINFDGDGDGHGDGDGTCKQALRRLHLLNYPLCCRWRNALKANQINKLDPRYATWMPSRNDFSLCPLWPPCVLFIVIKTTQRKWICNGNVLKTLCVKVCSHPMTLTPSKSVVFTILRHSLTPSL